MKQNCVQRFQQAYKSVEKPTTTSAIRLSSNAQTKYSKNKKTIIEGEKNIPDFIGFLSSLVGPSRMAKNRIGYVINAIKKKTMEAD